MIPDVPANSSIKYSFIIWIRSQSDYAENLARGNWDSANYYTFFRAAEGTSETQLQTRMPDLVEKYAAREGDNPAWRVQFLVQSLRDMHLHSRFNVDIALTGNATYVYLFLAVGFVILLLACVNYTNLAVGRSIKRAREVGLRKVVGAWRGQLVAQFLGESVLMAFLALVLALALVHLLLPSFGSLVERPIRMDYLGNGLLVPGLSALVLIVGLLSGSYPALFMASLRPIEVLLIASLGLFGLAAFAAEQRTKEIGIRKVLGADVKGLVALLSKDFLQLVGIAFIICAPIAYFAMQRWLESFAYRIDIGPAVFVVTGLAVALVALLAVSYQSKGGAGRSRNEFTL